MDDESPTVTDFLHDLLGVMAEIRDDLRAIRNTLESMEGE